MISGKAAKYKLFWIENDKGLGEVIIFLAKKWVDKVININKESDGMTIIKVLIHGIIISMISGNAQQHVLDER